LQKRAKELVAVLQSNLPADQKRSYARQKLKLVRACDTDGRPVDKHVVVGDWLDQRVDSLLALFQAPAPDDTTDHETVMSLRADLARAVATCDKRMAHIEKLEAALGRRDRSDARVKELEHELAHKTEELRKLQAGLCDEPAPDETAAATDQWPRYVRRVSVRLTLDSLRQVQGPGLQDVVLGFNAAGSVQRLYGRSGADYMGPGWVTVDTAEAEKLIADAQEKAGWPKYVSVEGSQELRLLRRLDGENARVVCFEVRDRAITELEICGGSAAVRRYLQNEHWQPISKSIAEAILAKARLQAKWPQPTAETPVDTPVWVRYACGNRDWCLRYWAGELAGKLMCWGNGKKSETTTCAMQWPVVVLADPKNPAESPPLDYAPDRA
jgi:hypothetical protein